MAKYGYCSGCGQTVWVNEDGSCPNGHEAEMVSNVVDDAAVAAAPVAGSPAVQPKKSKALYIVLGIVGVLLLCCCVATVTAGALGVLAPLGIAGIGASAENANQRACYANERTVEGAYQSWLANDAANADYTPSDYAELTGVLVDEGFIKSEPECPGGGYYELSLEEGGVLEVWCSEHGNYNYGD